MDALAAVAVAVQPGGVAAVPAVALAGDQVGERGVSDLGSGLDRKRLHGSSLSLNDPPAGALPATAVYRRRRRAASGVSPECTQLTRADAQGVAPKNGLTAARRTGAPRVPGARRPILLAPMRSILSRLIGGGNESHLSRLRPIVARINELEAHYEALTDEQIRAEMAEVRDEVREAAPPSEPSDEELETDGQRASRGPAPAAPSARTASASSSALDDVLPDVFAAAREVSRRQLGMRPFDVQLMGGVVLHEGKIAEMKTGEGKTLVAPLAAALNAMSGRGVHVVTVNDYLAKRDPQWMGPIYHGLGLSVGIVQHDTAFLYDPNYRPKDEKLTAPAPGATRGGLRRGRHLRHQQRAGLRLPARQHGPGPRRAGAARALLRHRRRGRQHPHRRGAHARSSSAARPASRRTCTTPSRAWCRAWRRARTTPSRAATTSSTSRSTPSRRPRRASPRSSGCSASATSTAWRRTRACRATSSRPCAPTRSTGATATTSSRTTRSSSSTSSRAARCPAGAGRRACTRPSRPRRACASSASR